ncbi:MAG TPA: NgoFVII family restriction endonuclease, partial [Paenibacillaceae bacterium]|nr:NgoFVII family restriction endonuclease [Paenibacillaceae bacterium]
MGKNRKVPLIITVINLIMGFMLAIQYQSMKTTYAVGQQDFSTLRQNLQKEME